MTVKYYKNQGHNCYFIEDNGTNEKQISVMTFYKYSKKGKFYGRTNYFLFFGEQVYHSGRFIKDLTIEDGKRIFTNDWDRLQPENREFDKIGLFPYPNQVIFEEDEEVKKKLWENCSNSAKEYKKAQFEEIND
ncbi:hypothetical protein Mgra_00001329 [Meloidogyne graminicola]|uniref:Uncharacterized protein n=1 Tax=Meloidogyne graminicola TaxID=189291 RepID=A0A8S9ZZN8_9BILA|nr:hypothetical protein Mgra_00001329 [Meloidogyne graminicola]